ncbi:hypothetical protein DSO57_1002714 [Entomophthora muscae]|uniref:Uncharacterized protein n=1 Tax=Entomophthora muscae TaxID=34485 RepID=A0ACC2UUE3_9FUNG|nr:hypothetical protein DSO57_1002714 [Entomophthora muscae]
MESGLELELWAAKFSLSRPSQTHQGLCIAFGAQVRPHSYFQGKSGSCTWIFAFEANPGLGKLLSPAPPAWWLGAGSNPVQGFERVTYVTATLHLVKGDSPNGHQIATRLLPLMTQTYTEVVAFLKEVKISPDTGPTNEHQLLLVPSPELATQLAGSGDVVNRSSRTEHCHFFPELIQPGSAALETELSVV